MGIVRSLMGIVGLVRRKRRLTMSWSGRSVCAALLRMLLARCFSATIRKMKIIIGH